MKKNLTLSLDQEIIHEARLVCQKKRTTLTKFIKHQLEDLVHHNAEYQVGMERMMRLMQKRPLRIGRKTWNRDELHER